MRRAGVLVLVCAALVAACGGDDDDVADTTSSTTTTVPTTSTTAAKPAIALGPTRALGDGTLVGLHPAGSIAYVSIVDHDTDEVGCEGGDVARLWAQPLDGGAAVRALPDSFLSGLVLTGGANGTIAVVDSCEGFVSSLTTARPDATGRFLDVTKIDTTAAESSGQLQPATISWGADDRSFVALVHDLEGDGVRAVRIRLDGTVSTLANANDLTAVGELADGTLVTATEDSVTIGHAAPVNVAVTSIALDPMRAHIAVFGSGGVTILSTGGAPKVVDDAEATVGTWSSTGDLLGYLRLQHDTASVWMVDVAGAGQPLEIDDNGGFGPPHFGSGSVAWNDAVDTGEGFSEPRAAARLI